MSGLKSRNKGARNERNFVKRMTELDLPAERVLASGAYKDYHEDLEGDVKLWSVWREWRVECKSRKDGWRELYKWLEPENIDFVSLKANNREGLILMTEATLAKILGEAERVE